MTTNDSLRERLYAVKFAERRLDWELSPGLLEKLARFAEKEVNDAIAATKEACAKTGHKAAFEHLNMQLDQRTYSWHEVEDALTEGSKAIRALPGPDYERR